MDVEVLDDAGIWVRYPVPFLTHFYELNAEPDRNHQAVIQTYHLGCCSSARCQPCTSTKPVRMESSRNSRWRANRDHHGHPYTRSTAAVYQYLYAEPYAPNGRGDGTGCCNAGKHKVIN